MPVLRVVTLSDIHNKQASLSVPDGDVLIVAGDFTNWGLAREVRPFSKWLESLPHRHKLVVCGNHEVRQYELSMAEIQSSLPASSTYLQETGVNIEGVHFWGAPWVPCNKQKHRCGVACVNNGCCCIEGRRCMRSLLSCCGLNLGFVRRDDELETLWSHIPETTDVLITHTPPHGILDQAGGGHTLYGCRFLLSAVGRVQPRVHVFGHIHPCQGHQWGPGPAGPGGGYQDSGATTSSTLFINAAVAGPACACTCFDIDVATKAVANVHTVALRSGLPLLTATSNPNR
eukprot:gnl/Hemi2/27068_TR9094_c0_g1_i1.p1 gnl/Hemi2/27068_TR9094_c0_g1~~gnl/Hemi2/27068_TR9094_c0_g1_i1.p1  ORF type:complete len:287 (-),score=30.51 gnl/Hemi2/27068_TR9094_c0_g1_i1:176-1036(-)